MNNQAIKRLVWASLLSILFMAFLLLKVDLEQFSTIAGRIVIKDVVLAFALLALANIIRALRFLKLDHLGNRLSYWWIINQVYNLVTATLPGGAGEAATVYILKKFSAFNILSAFRILVLTRIMDLTGLSSLLYLGAMLINKDTPYREVALWTSGAVFIISIIISHPKSERFIIRRLQNMPIKGRLIDKVCEQLEETATISETHVSGASHVITLLLSVVMIFIAALSVHFVLLSLGTGFTMIMSLYCFGIYALFQIVPIQGIAGIGTQAAWWSIALTMSGYKASDAIAMGIVLHGTFYLFIALMGITAVFFIPFGHKTAENR